MIMVGGSNYKALAILYLFSAFFLLSQFSTTCALIRLEHYQYQFLVSFIIKGQFIHRCIICYFDNQSIDTQSQF